MTVKFSYPEEFLDELKRDAAAGLVERKIVRLTQSFRQHPEISFLRSISIIATYSVNAALHGTTVRLERYIGDCMNRDEKVLGQAQKAIDELSKSVRELGLEVRAGIYE